MGEPGGLPSMGLHRVGHDWSDLAAAAAAAAIHTYESKSFEIRYSVLFFLDVIYWIWPVWNPNDP